MSSRNRATIKVLGKSKIKFQTNDVDFPKNLWAVVIWLIA